MKIKLIGLLLAQSLVVDTLLAQTGAATNGVVADSGSYSTDIGTVHDAQAQALAQARTLLARGEGVRDRTALESAIKDMESAQAALEEAEKSPAKLLAALAAEQAAYQALLKITPREFRMRRAQNGQNSGGGAGQPSERELNDLDLQQEQNRYETESQAAAPQDTKQRQQSETLDRLKQLAQRQQDLNERLRELQTALQAARSDEERADLQRQLKRLQDEQRQMLANVDEMRQQLAQSPDAGSQADTQKQLEQTRNDMERAAQQMEQQSASGALAAGTRAQETMQNLGDDLRKQTSSQFSEQMRQLRNQARDLTKRQDDIARGLDSLNNSGHQTLDNSAEREQVARQMEQQQSTLTNLLAEMRDITERAESSEPLLSKQLYDTLRRSDKMHTEDMLQVGAQLTERGFLPQASEVERATRTNITAIASSVEHAADSVLGSEADALRYAQKELDDLTRQMEREVGGIGTNASGLAPGLGLAGTNDAAAGQANRGAGTGANPDRNPDANPTTAQNGRSPGDSQRAGNNSQGQQPGNSGGQGQNGEQGQQAQANGENAGQNSGENPRAGQGQGQGQGQGRAANGENARGGNAGDDTVNRGGTDRLRQLAVQLGAGGAGGIGGGGPITGNGYANWAQRLRDVQQAIDPEDLRNQLDTVSERVSAMRADYRLHDHRPDQEIVRQQILAPLTQVRAWLQQEQARKENAESLVPLDRDPVPDNYSELVREYYEKLGSAQ